MAKLLIGLNKVGTSGDELKKLPNDVRKTASSSAAFFKKVCQVWGDAYGEAMNCYPPIDLCRIVITDSAGQRVGSVSVSKEDVEALITGKVMASDVQKTAAMWIFE